MAEVRLYDSTICRLCAEDNGNGELLYIGDSEEPDRSKFHGESVLAAQGMNLRNIRLQLDFLPSALIYYTNQISDISF